MEKKRNEKRTEKTGMKGEKRKGKLKRQKSVSIGRFSAVFA
jgi:hypothetical protein